MALDDTLNTAEKLTLWNRKNRTDKKDDPLIGTWDVVKLPENSRGNKFSDPRIINEDRAGITSMAFPINVTDSDTHYVRFYINVNEESSLIKKQGLRTLGITDNSEQARSNRNLSTIEAAQTAATVTASLYSAGLAAKSLRGLFGSKATAMSQIAGAVGLGVAGKIVSSDIASDVITKIADEFKMTNRLRRLAANITLYTPDNITNSSSMSYETTTDIMTDLMQKDQFEAMSKAMSNIGSAMRSVAVVGRIAASTNTTISQLSRTAVNKKRDMMFKAVDNRTFMFTYVFAPKNKKEAEAVKNIIYMFRLFSHPEMIEGYGNFLYLYPAEFDIEYGIRQNGAEKVNPHLNKISSCVLQKVDVNYAPNGSYQSLEDGEPIMTTVTLMFTEIETLHQQRIVDGY